jgi:exonuclease I
LKSFDSFIKESARKKIIKIEENENLIEILKNKLNECKDKVYAKRKEFEEKQSEVKIVEKKINKT